jgi:hypothetical protein
MIFSENRYPLFGIMLYPVPPVRVPAGDAAREPPPPRLSTTAVMWWKEIDQ